MRTYRLLGYSDSNSALESALPDNRKERSDLYLPVKWNRNSPGLRFSLSLNHHVAASLPELLKFVLLQQPDQLGPGEDPEVTHLGNRDGETWW